MRVTQCLLIASLYLPVCKIISLYNSIASLKSTCGTPLDFRFKCDQQPREFLFTFKWACR